MSVNVATSFLIPNAPSHTSPTQPKLLNAISLLVFTSVVFRAEVAVLLAPIALHAARVVPLARLIKTCTVAAALSIGEGEHRSDCYPLIGGKRRAHSPCGLLFLGSISPMAGTVRGLL